MGFPWRNRTILPFLSVPFEIFFVGSLYILYSVPTVACFHDNNIIICAQLRALT